MEEYSKWLADFFRLHQIRSGGWIRISFWHDLWVGNMTLNVAFLALFGIAVAKDTSIANNLEFLGGSNQWNLTFARETHDWEVDVFTFLFQMLHPVIVRRGNRIRFKKGIFKVKSFFHYLTHLIGTRFPWKCVVDPSPLKGGLLFVVGCSWKDLHIRQSQEAPCYRDKQMLHVQEDKGVRGSSSSPL
jgi:hypothetical protein